MVFKKTISHAFKFFLLALPQLMFNNAAKACVTGLLFLKSSILKV